MNEEPVDLETVKPLPELYPAVNHVMGVFQAVPYTKDIVYFKLQMLRNASEIIDV